MGDRADLFDIRFRNEALCSGWSERLELDLPHTSDDGAAGRDPRDEGFAAPRRQPCVSIYLCGCGLMLCDGDLICLAPHARRGFWSLPSDSAELDDSCIDRENLRFALSIT